ncbi:hypothetical protein J2W96_000540 [Variovorax guangxiensis]|nr:hypothetical protein [Variovorax guangxiensis]
MEWEAFAKTLEPAAALLPSEALRDHAHLIIKAIALDIEDFQSKAEQTAKSHGDGPANVKLDVAGELSDVVLSVTNLGPEIPPSRLKRFLARWYSSRSRESSLGAREPALAWGCLSLGRLLWPTVARSTSRLPMPAARPLRSAFPAPSRRQKRQADPECPLEATPRQHHAARDAANL